MEPTGFTFPGPTEDYPQEAVAASKAVVSSLLLAVKVHSLYGEEHTHCQRAVERLQNDLEIFLSEYEELIFHVEKNRLLFGGEVVHQGVAKDGDLTFVLFRDGIINLVFQRGIDSREINVFVRILDQYKSLPAEAEGDIVTALWEVQLPHVRYEAADNILEADPEAGFSSSEKGGEGLVQSTPLKEPDTFRPMEIHEYAEASLEAVHGTKELPRVDATSLQLTTKEVESLKEMVRRQEELDATQEILDMMADILKDQQDEEFFDVVLEYMEEELQTALGRKDFDLSFQILKRLHHIRQLCKQSRSQALSRINKFWASGPHLLASLQDVWSTISASEIVKAKKVLLLFPSKAIGTLGPMLLEARSSSVRRMLSDVILSLASRNLKPFEELLDTAEEDLVHRLVPLLGRMDGERSGPILVKMAHHPSERVRKEALRALMAHDLWVPDKVISLMDDESSLIRQLLIKYMGSRRSEVAEGLLLDYLRNRRFRNRDSGYLLACFRALGRCGTARSIPFLQDTLLRGGWISRFRASARRQGAAIALMELGTKQAKQVLEEASRSRYPAIRSAAQAAIQKQRGSGEER